MQATLCLFFLFLGSLTACGKVHKEKDLSPTEKKAQLEQMFHVQLALAQERATADGWLDTDQCDAMLFSGKYACALVGSDKYPMINIIAAEYPDQPGRFNRRPQPFCEAGAGSKTSWSRDMGKGLMAYAWCAKDLPVLERHAKYGVDNFWKMGEPTADGRVVYTPGMIGQLYELIYALGGEDNANRVWPNVYAEGLDDYEAHLQMIDIWLRGEVTRKPYDLTLDISQTMYQRVKEHSAKQPNCPFYQYMLALYETGKLERTVDLLLSTEYNCDYYHTDDRNSDVFLAEWLFAASQVLKY